MSQRQLDVVEAAWPGAVIRLGLTAAGVDRAQRQHGDGFHGAAMASTARCQLPQHSHSRMVASTSGSLTTAGSDLSLSGLDLGSGVFLKN
jgi:hypothetical protein